MVRKTRRQFVQQSAMTVAALCSRPLSSLAEAQGTLGPGTQSVAALDAAEVGKFVAKITGRVIAPASPEYEAARVVFNRAFDRHPALIVRSANSNDIARTLDFAQSHHLQFAVRGGGHSRAGFGVCDNGLVLDLSAMKRVEIDASNRVAQAEAGASVRDFDQASQRFGLATTMGGCPTVGIAGFTIGGGEGFLMSKYGAGCDNLLSAQVVTVDGRQIEASQNSNPDLFWAIRGGGGNFGVVTSLKYRLYPVTEVLAGTLTYPIGRIPELLQAFAKFVAAAPDEMNVVGQVLPSETGARFHMMVLHCGQARSGNDLLQPLRALKPQEDNIRVMSYLDAQTTINPYKSAAHFQTDLILPEFSGSAIETIAAAASAAPPTTRVFIVPIYGTVARVGVNDTAFPLRRACYEVDIMGRWNTSSEKAQVVQWVKALRDKLQPMADGVYANQLGETSDELVKAAYGTNYERLANVKKKYDPNNFLRLNQNIKPA